MQKCSYEFIALLFNFFFLLKLQLCASPNVQIEITHRRTYIQWLLYHLYSMSWEIGNLAVLFRQNLKLLDNLAFVLLLCTIMCICTLGFIIHA